MSRWEPDARNRLMAAALDLFAEHGFEQTTAADIAERAGVTERTFFRHFADKREVLFDGSGALEQEVIAAILAAPAPSTPVEAALAGMTTAAELLTGHRDRATRRARIIASHSSLRERELLKLAGMTEATARALRERGTTDPTATLAAHTAVAVFQVAFSRWVGDDDAPDFAACVAATTAALPNLR